MRKYYVYMLQCSDGSYYTGVTNDCQRRLAEHSEGLSDTSYTFSRLPVELVYVAEFQYVLDAIAWEKRIKRWGRKKKEALIAGATEKLHDLSFNHMQRTIASMRRNYHSKSCHLSVIPRTHEE